MQILQISPRKYVLTDTFSTGQANLNIYSQGRLGKPDEMIPVTNAQIITNKLTYQQAMLLYSLLQNKYSLTEEEWEWILPEQQNQIATKYQ
jgi:hypothetical protein